MKDILYGETGLKYCDIKNAVDGENMINLFKPKTKLGKRLNPYTTLSNPIKFIKWDIYNIEMFMYFLNREGVDENVFTDNNHTNVIKYIREYKNNKRRLVKDYWGIICYVLLEYVKSDVVLMKLIKSNDLRFAAWENKLVTKKVFDKPIEIEDNVLKDHIINYTKSIEFISHIIKNDIYKDDVEVARLFELSFPTIQETIKKILDGKIEDVVL